MVNNCEHAVALTHWCESGNVETENEIADFALGLIDSEIVKPSIQNEFDFTIKDIYSVDCWYEIDFFDYCPYCGCKIDKTAIKKRLNKLVVDKIASIDKAGYLKRLNEIRLEIKSQSPYHRKSTKKQTEMGYVYLVKMGEDYKIGVSKTPNKRLGEFTKLPNELEQICVVKVNGYKQVEEDLHDMFENRRKRGEWFSLDTVDIDFIKQYLSERRVYQ